jgi:hypothetical protein
MRLVGRAGTAARGLGKLADAELQGLQLGLQIDQLGMD